MKRNSSLALYAAVLVSALVSGGISGAGCMGGVENQSSDLAVNHDLAHGDMTDLSTINPLGNNPQVQKVSAGMTFQVPQSPLWLPKAGNLLFSDPAVSVIYQLTPPATLGMYRSSTNQTIGIAADPQGNIVMCELAAKQVTRRDQTGTVSTVASMYMGKAFNGPNDLIVRSDGLIYFTDPGSGSLGYEGLYSIAPATNAVTLLDQTMKFPDGLALTPDQKDLYVSASNDGKVYRFPINADGSLGTRSDFAQGLVSNQGVGMDLAGNVYVATSSGVRVFKPDGSSWGSLSLPASPRNLSFGGTDGKTLYIAAGTDLYTAQLQLAGLP